MPGSSTSREAQAPLPAAVVGCDAGTVDPEALIATALAAGSVASSKGVMTSVATDVYAGLKNLVLRRFRGQPAAEAALERLDDDPEAWRTAVRAELERIRAGDDDQLVASAQELLALLDAAGTEAGRYQVDARGAQGVQIGDHGNQSNVFNGPPPTVG
ncbi:hypothetical protein ACFV4F_07940 [Kitasatospora sp. NPDC059722]|uniref:hypothetical protein n=1 Tax=Kitasatospora sp. NPDC059722 TaxID=3346925 RepID=UPI003680364A